jgi:dTDP-4-dehydrorhamnose 3,5-epimerase-like enzyme
VQIWDGIRVEDDVFIGPNVTFTNDQFPRSRKRPVSYAKTTVKSGASIGANATILPGLFIGENAMIGAGAVVTRSVPAHAIVMGNPGRITGYVETERLSIDDAKQPSGNCSALTSKVRGVSFHRLTRHADMRGELVVANSPEQIPFSPVRMFIVFNVPTREVRGQHAHHKCHQYIMCTSGSVRVMVDDGVRREDFLLNQPDIGIYLPPLTWGEQFDYSADASLLVLASHPYDASDYIRDYHGFIKMVNGK